MFFSIRNLTSLRVEEIPDPWARWPEFKLPEKLKTKEERTAWFSSRDTAHAFLSGISGQDPRVRVTVATRGEGDNPPAALHALIADYDSPVAPERRETLMLDPPCPYLPTWICDSYSEGKSRLIWEFEQPVRMPGTAFAKEMFKTLGRKLALRDWLPGFDDASLKPAMYFGIGREWRPVASERVPQSILLGWAAEAALKVKMFDDSGRPRPCIERLSDMVSEKFPGKWPGDFSHGAQGPRFWDPSADNQRAAVVGEYGMICFTGPKAFVTWEEIFGSRAMDQVRGDQYGPILETFFYDGRAYWKRESEGRFLELKPEDARRSWNCAGFSRSRAKGMPSELDFLEEAVSQHNRVEEALPFVYMDHGILTWAGTRYLNIASARVIDPSPPFDADMEGFKEAGEGFFPWLYRYFSSAFSPAIRHPRGVPPDVPLADIPLHIYLAWLKRTFVGGYHRRPQTGQALVLAGKIGVGKTFLIQGVMARLLGGAADASDHIVGGSQFNAHLCCSPLMVVDDNTVSAREDDHRFYSAMLKRVVANAVMTYNRKYGAQSPVLWRGRAVVGCNVDHESLRILPDLDQSTRDKISLFEMRRGVVLPGWDAQEAIVTRELPFFARWLLNWKPPAWTDADPDRRGRYGVRGYHHATLLDVAMSSGPNSMVLEMLKEQHEEWIRDNGELAQTLPGMARKNGAGNEWVWEGRPLRLFQELAAAFPTVAGKMTADRVARALGVLSTRGFPISPLPDGLWRVEYGPGLYASTDPDQDPSEEIRLEGGEVSDG
jgi:hypothetical protein